MAFITVASVRNASTTLRPPQGHCSTSSRKRRRSSTCVANCPYVSTCTWTDGPEQQAAFRYDEYGNLIERIVTSDAGAEISRWIAVADKDGNLLREKQTAAGVLISFSRYDYSCW